MRVCVGEGGGGGGIVKIQVNSKKKIVGKLATRNEKGLLLTRHT